MQSFFMRTMETLDMTARDMRADLSLPPMHLSEGTFFTLQLIVCFLFFVCLFVFVFLLLFFFFFLGGGGGGGGLLFFFFLVIFFPINPL